MFSFSLYPAGVVQWRENRRKSSKKAQDEMVEQNLLRHDGPRREKRSHRKRKTDKSIVPQSSFFTEQGEQPENRDSLRTSKKEKTIQTAESGEISSGSRNNGNSPTCPTEAKRFTCLECGMSFRNQKQFAAHQKIHTGQKSHKCADCGKSYRNKWNLKVHKRTHTGEKPFKCTVCKKSFNVRSNLNAHQIIHTGVKPYKCSVCGKSFARSSYLNAHQITHTKKKPYKCSKCGKCFAHSSHLTDHKRTHTGEKPFKCSVCNKCFAQKSNLTRHQSIHKGQRPHECSICGKSFTSKSNLKRHQKHHTRETPNQGSNLSQSLDDESRPYVGENTQPKPIVHKRTEGQKKAHPAHPVEEEEDHVPLFPGGSCRASWEITVQTIPGAAKEQDVCIVGEENIWQYPNTCKRKVCLQETHSVEGPVDSKGDSSVPSKTLARTVVDATARMMMVDTSREPDLCIVYGEPIRPKPIIHKRTEGHQEAHPVEVEEDVPLLHGGGCRSPWEIMVQAVPGTTKEQDVCIVGEENIWQNPNICERKACLQKTLSVESPIHSKLDSRVPSELPAQTVGDAAMGEDICIVYEQGVLQKPTIHIRIGFPEETQPGEDVVKPVAGGEYWKGPNESTFQAVLNATKEQDSCIGYEEMIESLCFHLSVTSMFSFSLYPAGVVQWRENRRKSSKKAQDEMVEQNLLSHDGPRREKRSHRKRKTDKSIVPQSSFFTEQGEQPENRDSFRTSKKEKTIQTAESGEISSGSRNNGNSPTCPTEAKRFTCLECGMSFRNQKQFAAHQKIHTGQISHKCADCGKSYRNKWNLKVHKRTHTGEKPFKCTVCKKSFNVRSNLNAHQIIHTGVKPYKCSVCGKSFARSSYLNAHQITHTKKKPYKCSKCGKCFAHNSHLTDHKRTHTGEKPFKCSVCNKCFAQKSNLTRHQSIHKGQRPHECSICGKSFTRKSNLKRHQKHHTRETPNQGSNLSQSLDDESRPYVGENTQRI
ncbi:uncharacterized protein LOC144326775 [Podarcis muralis]